MPRSADGFRHVVEAQISKPVKPPGAHGQPL
jgi:hypothetical protein